MGTSIEGAPCGVSIGGVRQSSTGKRFLAYHRCAILLRGCLAIAASTANLPKDFGMRLEALRSAVLEANLELVRRGLILYTFGNASGIDRQSGLVAIKPSGVPYEELKPADLVLTDLDGNVVEGTLRPSSDLATHLLLYRAFPAIGGVVHTHSEFATAWAQAGREIPAYGLLTPTTFTVPFP